GASVRFQMMDANGKTVVDAPASILEASGNPTVAYEWAHGDTAKDGEYRGEFKITYFDGNIETFPNDSFIAIAIGADVPGLPGA
ncbi:MAG: hypothetical protein P5698_26320, partial [Limnospira sp. PMC 1295.21]|uniref:hypothetical protein n=1 Tax=Limnospira sp. PMC 1295.21 TaxID=2981078 RepID=UPI0028E145CE